MCQMYAIFEEVVGPQPSVSFTKDLPDANEDDQGIVLPPNDQLSPTDNGSPNRSSQYGSSRARTKRGPGKQQRLYGHKHSTLPRSNRRRLLNPSDTDNLSSTSSSNPLLDTISVLAYDPPDDSDDCYDLTGDVYDRCPKESEEKPGKGTEGDRDSIGYAGSSSIDSGYKSFCPTPEIPDPSFYGSDRTQNLPGLYADSSLCRGGKPRIMMGTKVISRQGPASPPSARDSPVLRRSDASLYDVNLDHLMYLRQSLLSAIQKCESSKGETCGSSRKESSFDNCLGDHSCAEYSPAKNPKTVRFNNDVKVSTVHTSQPPSESAEPSRTGDTVSEHGVKAQSKSILKDPLCANLRSQLEAGSGDCTLEEEIDSLLYGRAEFYDLESVDDFPCSYVTMIEEKYRSAKPSLAKVRKLKGSKISDTKSGSQLESENSPSKPTSEDDSRTAKTSDEPSTTVSISKTAKCRFTEVARCMLEIIEDLQMKKMQPESNKTQPTTETGEKSDLQKEEVKDSPSTSKSEFYTSAAEYHVYEEIVYDFVGNPSIPKLPELPPPLPARPSSMFLPKPEQPKGRAPSPPPRKSRCLSRKTDIEVRNRPKQRSNLYSLFADRAERRNISRSLEREFRVSGSDNQEDDYGFKKESSSI